MEKQEIYAFLRDRNLWHEITEHAAVYNMAEVAQIEVPYPEADAKNLFLRDDKKRNYYLVTVKGDKRVDLKKLRQENGTRSLRFASSEELLEHLGLTAGSVTPFGLLNDREGKVIFFLDRDFFSGSGLIGVHPNANTATVWMKVEDLVDIIREHGNEIRMVSV